MFVLILYYITTSNVGNKNVLNVNYITSNNNV